MTAVAASDWALWAPGISLEELVAGAALQTRVDRKYVLDAHRWTELAARLSGDVRVLTVAGDTAVRYESVYFDTPDLRCFHDAAHGRRRRFKVRTRSYTDSGVCFLEVKTVSGRGQTVKRREPHPYTDRAAVTSRAFVAEVLGRDDLLLRPALLTRYSRTTLVDLVAGWRLTVDSDLTFATPDGRSVGMPGRIVAETKTSGRATPMDHVLWRSGVRPTRISKYGVGLAALDPALPANRWSRTLRRHTPSASG